MGKNAIVGQSGGPTSVINASLAGVFESCKNRGADIVLSLIHISMISATVTLRMLYTEESRMTSFKMVAMYFAAEP